MQASVMVNEHSNLGRSDSYKNEAGKLKIQPVRLYYSFNKKLSY